MADPVDNSDPYFLDVTLTHANAAHLVAALQELRGRNLVIDASKVEHLGAQCLQILLSACKTWQAEKFDICVVERSICFNEGMERFGFQPEDIPDQENFA